MREAERCWFYGEDCTTSGVHWAPPQCCSLPGRWREGVTVTSDRPFTPLWRACCWRYDGEERAFTSNAVWTGLNVRNVSSGKRSRTLALLVAGPGPSWQRARRPGAARGTRHHGRVPTFLVSPRRRGQPIQSHRSLSGADRPRYPARSASRAAPRDPALWPPPGAAHQRRSAIRWRSRSPAGSRVASHRQCRISLQPQAIRMQPRTLTRRLVSHVRARQDRRHIA